MARKRKVNHNPDRLSSLPNVIICRIISFLDTKSAITTSLLSRRYRRFWTSSLPSLDFKGSGFLFEHYVTSVVQRRQPADLRSFRLWLLSPVRRQFVSRCLTYAARRNVQHLRIRGHTDATVRLPVMLLRSTSLVTLRLSNATAVSMELPLSVTLPNLRGLRLENFKFRGGNYHGQLFPGCPNLENLVLIKCRIRPNDGLRALNVSFSKLRSLEIRDWRSSWEWFEEHIIYVTAPALAFFMFRGNLARVKFKISMPALKGAYIDLSYPAECPGPRMRRISETLDALLNRINVAGILISILSKTNEVLSQDKERKKATLRRIPNLEIVGVRAEEAEKYLKSLFWPHQI